MKTIANVFFPSTFKMKLTGQRLRIAHYLIMCAIMIFCGFPYYLYATQPLPLENGGGNQPNSDTTILSIENLYEVLIDSSYDGNRVIRLKLNLPPNKSILKGKIFLKFEHPFEAGTDVTISPYRESIEIRTAGIQFTLQDGDANSLIPADLLSLGFNTTDQECIFEVRFTFASNPEAYTYGSALLLATGNLTIVVLEDGRVAPLQPQHQSNPISGNIGDESPQNEFISIEDSAGVLNSNYAMEPYPSKELVTNDRFTCFPNPATDYTYLHNPFAVPVTFELYSIEGRLEARGCIPAETNHLLSLANMPRGRYIVSIVMENKHSCQAILVR